MSTQQYAEVILPLPLNATFTYRIPEQMDGKIMPGHRVIVPFGRAKFYTAIVQNITPIAPEGYDIKDISARLDDAPVVRHPQIKMWQWIADYYLCSIGDVYKAAVPAGLKVESETMVQPDEDFDTEGPAYALMTERERIVLSALISSGSLSPKEIEKETGLRNVNQIVNSLLEKRAVRVSEKLNERYRAKRVNYVKAVVGDDNPVSEYIDRAFAAVKGAPRQEEMLMALIQLSGLSRQGTTPVEVTREFLLDKSHGTTATLHQLEKKGLVESYAKEVSRFQYTGPEACPLPQLNDAQTLALNTIHKSFTDHDVTLLHGVTSSGKTEVYIHLIDYVLRQGRGSVLYLVPEIALTTQLTTRLQRVFGDKVVIYHSRFSDNERVDIWRGLLTTNQPRVVIGARSAVFLPFSRLGLVIVDEEHDPSYKQQDPAPRYNGRDAAIVLATMHGAKVLLGSATPAIDTYYKATTGKYGLATITTRYGNNTALPDIDIVDMNREKQRGSVNGVFSHDTIAAIRRAVKDGRQAIIFRNRRGYAPVAICRHCEYIPRCQNCDVTLTYHRHSNTLECHYCGATYSMPEQCPVCKEPSITVSGYGTERLEDDVATLFPEARILRMDLDTTRAKESHAALIDKFSRHQADILVGTQMVTKGLDFAGVQVVAIPDADSIIYHPDFRATERAFAMLEQVAGRAGRRSDPQDPAAQSHGQVIIQTRTPSHPILARIKEHDYLAHYNAEIEERRQYAYPPFTRVIYIYLKHRDPYAIDTMSSTYATELRKLFGTRVFGPDKPSVSRVQQLHIRKIMLKVELQASMQRVKELLIQLHAHLHARGYIKGLIIYYDVDPQ